MKKEILISSSLNENRIAITENGKLAEYFVEIPEKEKYVGNIYLGKITRILPSLNAAFVDIGLEQNAFLHFSDIDERFKQLIFEEDEGKLEAKNLNEDIQNSNLLTEIDQMIEELSDTNKNVKNKNKTTTKKKKDFKISFKENQNIIVQVVREAFSNKGVKVTTRIALPGRYLVLVPDFHKIGISRKIHSPAERRRLREITKGLVNGFGCIVRTAAYNVDKKELENDWNKLVKTWHSIEKKVKEMDKPGLLYKDIELTASIIRDLLRDDISKVIVDSKKLHREIVDYLSEYSPTYIEKIELYKGKIPLFDYYNLEKEIQQTYQRKVNLPSGGTIIIDQTEAMVIIDVNSGRLVNEQTQEANAFRTNLEAVEEIARQIRLRDLAGMIVIDFIDMKEQSNRQKIYLAMKKALKKDRAKTVVYPLTELSLMQLTRQRINLTINEKITQTCPLCRGLGRIPTKSELLTKIERWLKNFKLKSKEFRLSLYVHPYIADYLTEGKISRLTKLMIKYFVKIKLIPNENLLIDQFRFESVKLKKDITNEYWSFSNE